MSRILSGFSVSACGDPILSFCPKLRVSVPLWQKFVFIRVIRVKHPQIPKPAQGQPRLPKATQAHPPGRGEGRFWQLCQPVPSYASLCQPPLPPPPGTRSQSLLTSAATNFEEVFVLCWRRNSATANRSPSPLPSPAGRGRSREVRGPTKVIESHDTRADSPNAASFVHELSFTAATLRYLSHVLVGGWQNHGPPLGQASGLPARERFV
jgi:hypothetical protein